MPLCRYQIRNEFTLADREVYSAADKDDPEALLEGFAMAALVGALRQLGDLAEFAAEIFSDLHDKVVATSARSHGLMVRVQHLETEIPLIEKAFLKQTNHSSFFYRAGVDWHPNMQTDQNCITKGDLPRFITNSYEESRGPPSFIFLDRFDVGGEGACLKRYTNPSFYNLEAPALETTNSDVHGEKKSGKGKCFISFSREEGPNGEMGELRRLYQHHMPSRNGRTPKALPTSHAKLHQLLLEGNKEDNVRDPARRVKLKRRLTGFPLNLKTGEGCMQKILKDHSPDHESLKRVSIGSVPIDFDTEGERHFIGSETPGILLTNRNPSQEPELKNVVSYHILGANNSSSNLLGDVCEKNILVDRESNAKATIFGYQLDDVSSEVDIYIDPLASEPQIYSDPKLATKTDIHLSSNRHQVPGLDDTKSLHQTPFPDSQSIGSSTLLDDGISLLKQCILSSSYSDGVSKIERSIPLEAEVSNEYLINEIIESKSTSTQLKWRGAECNDVADNLALSSEHTEQTISSVLPAQRDEDSTMYDLGILKVENGGMNAQDLTGTSIPPFQGDYGCSIGVFETKRALTSVVDKHLDTHECLSFVPTICDASYSGRASKNQDMEKSEQGDLYLDPDDGTLITNEENLSTSQHLNGSADDDLKVAEYPPKLIPEDSSLKELDRDFRNEASGTCSEHHSIVNRTIVHVTKEKEVNASSLNMPQGEVGIDYSKASSVGSQIYSPITIMPPAEIPPLRVSRSDANAERHETELSQCEMKTGVSKAGDDKLLVKSCIKQTENANHIDQEGYHIIPPLSFLESLRKQQWRFNLLTRGSTTTTDAGKPNVPLGSVSPIASKIKLNEVPPPPPLPPVQGKLGRNQPISLGHVNEALSDKKGQSLLQSMTNQNTPQHTSLGKDSPLVHESTSGNSILEVHANEVHGDKLVPSHGQLESITQKLPLPANLEKSQHDDHIGPNSIKILQGTTADVAAADTGQTHVLAAMNQQKGAQLSHTLIDSIAAHDKTKLRKVTDQAGSKVQISDGGRDSLLEEIRAKAFNLRPTKVQRPNIQGPTTNLRVAAILQKAKTIRHAYSGSDEDNDDSWSD